MTRAAWLGAGVFAAGAVYEFGCARWVAHVGAGRKMPAVLWSGVNCIVTLTGVEALLRGRLFAVLYVLGFMAGTWLSMLPRWRGRRRRPEPQTREQTLASLIPPDAPHAEVRPGRGGRR